ncbi:GntR family transcriptional regulator [Agrococcus carbonis]|uniref:DNA-binding transcriptional regulator, GntR family n=1 Tax=Agrococcus carbonis TaxID=684552 RepID=A0A1H1RUM9_9MICO|nr:GntR family transcriptional regulator [Agrococcus carbonis]SDS39414.1 DNA-binding transcriptional regulator, GntR family [Agrococcus carbonis]
MTTTRLPLRVGEIERRGLRDRVYELILDMLLTGGVEPGSRLSIDTLAKQLDVSPTPVREAMVQLERTGLVTREALKGYRVAPPLGPQELTELFDARVMLEVEAARLVTPRVEALLPQLRDAHELHGAWAQQVTEAMTQGADSTPVTQEYFAADAAFHRAIFEGTANRFLLAMHDDLGALTHRLRQAVIRGVHDVEEAHAEHGRVLEAFERGDAAAAADAMRAHIEGVRTRSMRDAAPQD